ncbi:MAG: hypothetical protein QOH74_926, partial [Gaiellales bacterium]|nr:hypothetical protein [Gaiellales bacterium]
SSRRWIACADLHAPAKGPSLRASACESSATVTVEYAPPVKTPIPTSTSRTVVVGTHNCT